MHATPPGDYQCTNVLAEVIPAAVLDSASPMPPVTGSVSRAIIRARGAAVGELGRVWAGAGRGLTIICAAYGYRPFDTAGVERELWFW
jgi:hypothetical protein